VYKSFIILPFVRQCPRHGVTLSDRGVIERHALAAAAATSGRQSKGLVHHDIHGNRDKRGGSFLFLLY
jgi:hypothetical protein